MNSAQDRWQASSGQATPHQFVAPGMPRNPYVRQRLIDQISELFESYSVVELVAAAGSGKTVQAQLFAAQSELKVGWFSIGGSVRSASRFVFDLAGALTPIVGDVRSDLRRILQHEGTVEELVARLAASLGDVDALLVLDQCEELAQAPVAVDVIDRFLDVLPDHTRVLLAARDDLPARLCRRYVHGQSAQVSEALNLTVQEVADYLSTRGGDPVNAESIHASTGGWFAGVAFATRFGVREQPNHHDLSKYLAVEVLDRLSAEEQSFLMATSVAEGVVSRELATALTGPDAHRDWAALGGRHLPATRVTSTTIEYHSLLREFLEERLLVVDPTWHRDLKVRHAQFMENSRDFEAATEAWIRLGETDRAVAASTKAIPDLYSRADWATIERWISIFGHERVQSEPLLIGAWIRAVYGSRSFERAGSLVRRLDREGRLRWVLEADPGLLMTTAWALQSQPRVVQHMLDRYSGDHRSDVVRYMNLTVSSNRPSSPPEVDDLEGVERILAWALFVQGRLRELSRLAPADDASPLLNPNVILGPTMLGQLDRAHELWSRVPSEMVDRPQTRFIRAMLLQAEGQLEKARDDLIWAAAESRAGGFPPLTLVYEIFAARIMHRLGETERATIQLEGALEAAAESGHAAYLEWAQAFLGLAYLSDGRTEDARLITREAAASMNQSERHLMLPVAAAVLSEAEARLGDGAAAHEAAEMALRASKALGSMAGLVSVITAFPAIQAREREREPSDMRWLRLMVAPSARPVAGPVTSVVSESLILLQPFGHDRDIYLDGIPSRIRRLKVLELLAMLSANPRGIDRAELQHRLFPEADPRNAGNYFRQIVHKLRQTAGLSLTRHDNLIAVPATVNLRAVDLDFEYQVKNASSVVGEERVGLIRSALDLVTGPYLETSVLPWVEHRRDHLEIVYEEAQLEYARLLLALDHLAPARDACEELLAKNRHSDAAYRVLMAIERKVGTESSALAVYRRAQRALEELDLRPGDARRLLTTQTSSAPIRAQLPETHTQKAPPRPAKDRTRSPR